MQQWIYLFRFFPPTHLILTTKKDCNAAFVFNFSFNFRVFYFWICIVVVVFTSTAHTEFSSRAKMTSNRYVMIEMAEDSNETEKRQILWNAHETKRHSTCFFVVVVVGFCFLLLLFVWYTCSFPQLWFVSTPIYLFLLNQNKFDLFFVFFVL